LHCEGFVAIKGGDSLKNFFERVYELVAQIPQGKVATYGQIAGLLGDRCNARVVGWAMKAAPSNLPCHRVVNRLGEMAPGYVFGSRQLQKDILESEGVTFKENECIDLKRHLWEGPKNVE
jgi:methylated-DNA-protein-cysteine methyltransferase related protein